MANFFSMAAKCQTLSCNSRQYNWHLLIDSRLPVLYSIEASITSLLAIASQLLLASHLSINQLPLDIGADGSSQSAKRWKQKRWYNDFGKESSSLHMLLLWGWFRNVKLNLLMWCMDFLDSNGSNEFEEHFSFLPVLIYHGGKNYVSFRPWPWKNSIWQQQGVMQWAIQTMVHCQLLLLHTSQVCVDSLPSQNIFIIKFWNSRRCGRLQLQSDKFFADRRKGEKNKNTIYLLILLHLRTARTKQNKLVFARSPLTKCPSTALSWRQIVRHSLDIKCSSLYFSQNHRNLKISSWSKNKKTFWK